MPDDLEAIQAAIERGDAASAQQLLPVVYGELKKLAHSYLKRQSPGQTLQTTGLVHEAYMRLVGTDSERDSRWSGNGHFFGAAAKAMRRILIDRARARGAVKRGGDRLRLQLDDLQNLSVDEVPAELIDLDEALTRLEKIEPEKAELVSLRFFAGLSIREAAAVLGISESSADRHWAFARAWLLAAMREQL